MPQAKFAGNEEETQKKKINQEMQYGIFNNNSDGFHILPEQSPPSQVIGIT